jgi:two-component system, response regulator RegA
MSESQTLLIVEDDDALRARLARAFEKRGLEVRSASSAGEALDLARADPPELALVDLRIGATHGLDLIPALRDLDPGTRIVVLTGYGSVATAVQAVRLGAVHYLTKPADADEILAAFDRPIDSAEERTSDWRPMSLDRVEWEHINRVLVASGGNISEAARLLRVHRRTLQRKLAKFPSSG